MFFSGRTPSDLSPNEWALEIEKASKRPILDLIQSNPTLCGFQYPPEFLNSLQDPRSLAYEPDPFGLPLAREALAAYLSEKGPKVTPDRIVLTASTSEAYTYLFKLLADPGDSFLYRVPGYPLLEHLARLESVELIPCPSLPRPGWPLDPRSIPDPFPDRCRGMILVDPNNPTGSYLCAEDKELLEVSFAQKPLAYISDEVFFEYAYPGPRPLPWAPSSAVSFRLGGLSKSLGLPQLKLSWIALQGPGEKVRECLERLELIADSYLSVNSPVQWALPELLKGAGGFQAQVLERVLGNRRHLENSLRTGSWGSLGPAQGGWYALLEVPSTPLGDEALAVGLLREEGVLTQPGGFYDLTDGKFLVLSLLPPPDLFQEGVKRLQRYLERINPSK